MCEFHIVFINITQRTQTNLTVLEIGKARLDSLAIEMGQLCDNKVIKEIIAFRTPPIKNYFIINAMLLYLLNKFL